MKGMVLVNTSDLIGYALDWAVGKSVSDKNDQVYEQRLLRQYRVGPFGKVFNPSSDWSQGGPLIDTYAIGFSGFDADNWQAFASPENVSYYSLGPSHLIAACRLIVFAELGGRVGIPAVLSAGIPVICPTCLGNGEVWAGTSSYQGEWQPPEPDMEPCGECGGDGKLLS